MDGCILETLVQNMGWGGGTVLLLVCADGKKPILPWPPGLDGKWLLVV